MSTRAIGVRKLMRDANLLLKTFKFVDRSSLLFCFIPFPPPLPQDSTVNREKNWGANLRKQSLHLQFQCGPQRELLNSLRVILAQ